MKRRRDAHIARLTLITSCFGIEIWTVVDAYRNGTGLGHALILSSVLGIHAWLADDDR